MNEIRIAIRSLLKHRGFTVVAVLTLALGIGATTAIFSVTHAILLRPLPYESADRIVALWQTAKDNPGPSIGGTVSHLNYLDWKREAKSFESLALYSGANFILTGLGEAELMRGAIVTPDFFRVFRATPVMGREFSEEEDRPGGTNVVVISHGFWTERLGARPDVLGTTIEISSRPRTIVGIAPLGFNFPNNARIWTPVQNNDQNCGRDCVYLDGIARLKNEVTPEQAREEIQAIAASLEQLYPSNNTNVTAGLLPLQDETVRTVRLALMLLFASVTLVLLIACANVANLVLVRGTTRQSELAVRAALGGNRRRLLSYLCTENLVLALFGGTLGLALAYWGVDALKRYAPTNIPRLDEISFDATTFVFALALAIATMMLFGLGPALQMSRVSLSSLLGSRGSATGRYTRRSRSILVAAEVGLSLVLMIGAGLLLRSLNALQSVDPGFRADGVSIFTLAFQTARYPTPTDVVRTLEQLDEQFSSIPGVTSVGYIAGLPLGPSEDVQNVTRPDRPAPPPGQVPAALYRVVDPDYFSTLGIPIVAGRPFLPSDREGSQPVIVISRRMADELFPQEEPLGKLLQLGRTQRLIIGIAANVRSQTLEQPAGPEMYLPEAQVAARALTFVLRSQLSSGEVISAARRVVQNTDKNLPLIRSGTLSEIVDQQVARPRFYMLLLTLFAVLAVSLAAIGTYGVVAYAVAQRTREIGVRLALGARPLQVVGIVLWQGCRPAAIGIALGLAASLWVTRSIRGLLFEVPANDAFTFILVTATLIALVLAACIVPARRAVRVSPATALRNE